MNQKKENNTQFFVSKKKAGKNSGHRCKRAFSIVEVMIAASIISIGVLAVLQLLYSSLGSLLRDSDAIVATELAQEGLEYAYNVRDNNLANGRPAFPTRGDNKFPGTISRDFCRLDSVTPFFILSGVNRNCFPNASQSQHRYSLNQVGAFYSFQNVLAKYARVLTIELDNTAAPKSAEITSIVWWGGSDVPPTGVFPGVTADSVNLSQCTRINRCVYIRTILEDWR